MIDFLYAVALTAAIGAGSALALWGIERCCAHELRMIQRRATKRQVEGHGGISDGLAAHADGDTYVAR